MNFKFGLLVSVCLSSILANPVGLKDERKPFTIEEAVLGRFQIKSFTGQWISDDDIEYYDTQTKEVKVVNVATNKTEVILKASILEKYNTTKYKFSADRKFVLISYDEIGVYRHSRTARYVVYSIKDGAYYDVAKKERIQIAEWSPKDNTLIYIKENNIYLIQKIDCNMSTKQLTTTGSLRVFNGVADWVYEEEVLASGRAFWFSPKADQLVYVRFNDTNVQKAVMAEYGEPRDYKYQYVQKNEIHYPKAGSPIPDFEIWHISLTNTSETRMLTKFAPGKEVFYEFGWVTNDVVKCLRTNRVQNESITYMCEVNKPDTYKCKIIFQYKNKFGWANTNFPVTSEKGDRMLQIEGQPVGKSGNFSHLVFYGADGSSYPLTGGYFEVIKILHWDESKKVIYFSATEEFNATTTQVYVVSEAKGSKPVCLTCRIKSPEGRGCKDAAASFSKKFSYVIVTCNGPDPRMVYLYKNVHPFDKPLAVLEDNAKLRSELQKKLMPEVMNLTVDIAGSFKADVRLFLPPNMDRSGKTKYPLLIYVYAGPGSKLISDAFKMDWGHYISTNLSVIYGFIDGRNTLKKGHNMLYAGYRALGTYEMEDQMNVTRILQKKFSFIDSTRTAIWGWSYGGYATTKILELDTQNIFKCGIAVAPVADWMYYDSTYTERYLGLPQENKKGYETSSVLKDISNLRNKKYFLIHGNADDNVHYQNAMMIAKLLERKNIPFELMSYPDEDHSLGNVRNHLYHTMDRFWKKCFNICN